MDTIPLILLVNLSSCCIEAQFPTFLGGHPNRTSCTFSLKSERPQLRTRHSDFTPEERVGKRRKKHSPQQQFTFCSATLSNQLIHHDYHCNCARWVSARHVVNTSFVRRASEQYLMCSAYVRVSLSPRPTLPAHDLPPPPQTTCAIECVPLYMPYCKEKTCAFESR